MSTIDTSYLEEVCGGSAEIINEMVQIFFDQIPEFRKEMKEFLETGNYQDLGNLAHKAKSSVAVMGMEDLASKLKELELKAKTGEDKERYPEYLDFFITETDKAILELNNYTKGLEA